MNNHTGSSVKNKASKPGAGVVMNEDYPTLSEIAAGPEGRAAWESAVKASQLSSAQFFSRLKARVLSRGIKGGQR